MGAQNSGAITAKYTATCANPPTADVVSGWNIIAISSAMMAVIQPWAREWRTWLLYSINHQENAARLMAKAETRIGRRNGCVPGRYNSAGSAV